MRPRARPDHRDHARPGQDLAQEVVGVIVMVHRNAFALAWPAAVWIIVPEPVAKCAFRENGDEPGNQPPDAPAASDPRLRGDRPRAMGEAGGGDGRGVARI